MHASTKKLLWFILIIIIAISVLSTPNYTIANETVAITKPTITSETYTLNNNANLTIDVIVEPLRELETSYVSMKLNVTYNFLEIAFVRLQNVIQNDKKIDVFSVEPENKFYKITQPELSVDLLVPMAYYFMFTIRPKSGSSGIIASMTYTLNVTVFYRNETTMQYSIESSETIQCNILPNVTDMPPKLQNAILSTLSLAILLPILVWLFNRRRKIGLRKKKFQNAIGLIILFGLLIFVQTTNNIRLAQGAELNDSMLLTYNIYIFKDIYNNDTYYLTRAMIEHLWVEKLINASTVIIGKLYIGAELFPVVNYSAVNLDDRIENTTGLSIFWMINPVFDRNNPMKIMNYSVWYNFTESYYIFSMLRNAYVFGSNNKNHTIKAVYDASSGILYQLIIKDHKNRTITAYRLSYLYNIQLSEKWDYYYEVFFIIISVPTIIMAVLTWPKKSKFNKRRAKR